MHPAPRPSPHNAAGGSSRLRAAHPAAGGVDRLACAPAQSTASAYSRSLTAADRRQGEQVRAPTAPDVTASAALATSQVLGANRTSGASRGETWVKERREGGRTRATAGSADRADLARERPQHDMSPANAGQRSSKQRWREGGSRTA